MQGLEAAWRRFRRQWDNYEIASRLVTQDTAYRAAVFKTCLTESAQEVLEGLPFENPGQKNEICEVYETYKFRQKRQQKGETIDAFVSALRHLASSCDFKTFSDKMLRDQLVFGLADDDVRQKLLQQKGLDLARCIELCRVHEALAVHARCMAAAAEIHQVAKKGRRPGHGQSTSSKSTSSKSTTTSSKGDRPDKAKDCKYCGKSHRKGKEFCGAYGQTCRRCGKKHHYASQCKSRDRAVHEFDEMENDSSDAEYDYDGTVLAIDHDESRTKSELYANMLIGEKVKVKFQLDSGASVNTMLVQTYKTVTGDNDLTDLPQTNTRLRLYDKTAVQPVGEDVNFR